MSSAAKRASVSSSDGDLLEELRLACEQYKDFAKEKFGKIYEKTQALAREFLNDWGTIFRVLEHPELPLTNNEAEQILRQWVILRRLCYGTRTKQGSRTIDRPVSQCY